MPFSMSSGGQAAVDSAKKKKAGAPRGVAFTDEQCVVITKAMIAAKNDPVRGSGQKKEAFLTHFVNKYKLLAHGNFPHRSPLSLAEKFKNIFHDCGQYRGILYKIRNGKIISGATTSDAAEEIKVCFAQPLNCMRIRCDDTFRL